MNDAFNALQWLAREAPTFGLDPARLAVGGDSAGGTLAIICAVLARDAGIDLRLQLLIYPGTSAWQKSASHARLADGYLLSGETTQWFFALMLYEGVTHEFFKMGGFVPEVGDTHADAVSALRAAFD